MITVLPIPETTDTAVIVIPADPSKMKANGRSIYEQARVAAYCRVSTDEEEQLSSYESQVDYYTDKIISNPNWTLKEIYADEGITGTSTKKRANFLRMIRHCRNKKIDIIITKSISRFARNTVDTLQYIRELRSLDIAVIFEKEGINTLEMTDETILTILSMIAQSESESISKNVSMGIRMKYKAGKVPFRGQMLGYIKGEDGKPKVVPELVPIEKKIFSLYLEGNSMDKITEHLENLGIKSPGGSSKWSASTIFTMLQNEKYVGDAILQKTFIKDCLTKKAVKNDGILPKYLIQNHHEAIIDRVTFNRVQEEIARRKSKRKVSNSSITEQGKYSGKYALTELLICGPCNTPYRRVTWSRNGKKKIVWRCINRLDHGKKYCSESPTIEESILQSGIVRAINQSAGNISRFLPIAQKNLSLAVQDDESGINRYELQTRIAELKQIRGDLIKLSSKPDTDHDKFDDEFKKIADELKSITHMLEQEERKQISGSSLSAEINEVLQTMSESNFRITEYDDMLVRKLIECVRVKTDSVITVIFKGGVQIDIDLLK